MRIENIETIRVAVPFETGGARQGMRPSLRPWLKMESLMVRVEADDGLVGWGEAFGHFVTPATGAALQTQIGPWFLGQDPTDVASLMDQAHRSFFGFGRHGPAMYALAAMDIALWDLAEKRAGQPLFRMLGGTRREIKRYASLMRNDGDADAIAKNCVKASDAGFGMIKLREREIPGFVTYKQPTAQVEDLRISRHKK